MRLEQEQEVELNEYTSREIFLHTHTLLSSAEWINATSTEQLNLLRRYFVYARLPAILREPFNDDDAVYASSNSHIVHIMNLLGTFSAQYVVSRIAFNQ